MGTFDERRRGLEEKFRLEEELAFRITARRNRLFGKWAAKVLGLSGNDAEAYERSVILADLETPGDDDVIGKVEQDFNAKSIVTARAQLREMLSRFAEQATAQIATR
jgi:hypothetical protein